MTQIIESATREERGKKEERGKIEGAKGTKEGDMKALQNIDPHSLPHC